MVIPPNPLVTPEASAKDPSGLPECMCPPEFATSALVKYTILPGTGGDTHTVTVTCPFSPTLCDDRFTVMLVGLLLPELPPPPPPVGHYHDDPSSQVRETVE